MHVIVVGCGRVGSTVANELVARDHDVVVIDRRREAFRRLGSRFTGTTMTGVGFDRDVLTRARISDQSAVMAVTSGDNSNILIARVARETFGVERVVARIYDPQRAVIYERLGIPTVASVSWTSARALRHVLPDPGHSDWIDPTSTYALVERKVQAATAGVSVGQLDEAGLRVVLLTRTGAARLPDRALLVQQDDLIHLLVRADATADVDRALLEIGGHR
jgi:trk system potassium uptake protein TrkA